jgi:hypothetical protein
LGDIKWNPAMPHEHSDNKAVTEKLIEFLEAKLEGNPAYAGEDVSTAGAKEKFRKRVKNSHVSLYASWKNSQREK